MGALEASSGSVLDALRRSAASFRRGVWVIAVVRQAAPRVAVCLLVFLVLKAAATPAELLLLRRLIDLIAGWLESGDSIAGPDWALSLVFILAIAGTSLLQSVASHAIEYCSVVVRGRIARYLGKSIVEKCSRVAYPRLENAEFCNLLDRARRGAQSRIPLVAEQVIDLCIALVQWASLWVLALRIHPAVPACLLLAMPPMIWAHLRGSAGIWSLYRGQTEDVRWTNYLTELLTTRQYAHEVRQYGLGSHFRRLWYDRALNMRKQQMSVLTRNELLRSTSTLGMVVLVAIAVWLLLLRVSAQQLTIGDYVMLTSTLILLTSRSEEVLHIASRLRENLLVCSDIRDFLSTSADEEPKAGSSLISFPLRTGISFESVSFRYPGSDKYVLQDLSFSIAPGEIVAIVGCNGAGKTTIVKLLLGLYEPIEGRILFDGIALEHGNRHSVWDSSAVLFQDFTRYQLSLRQNIGLGRVEELDDDHALLEAARLGGIDYIVRRLPNGLDSLIGKQFGDTDLSGGEWQRVALGRVFFRRADLLILDEPTAALDPMAEADLYRRFTELARGKTVILISHRLGSVRLADRILVLSSGRITESGSHDRLMKLGREYAAMYRSQASWYEDRRVATND